MKPILERLSEEFYFYSSQLVIFFIAIIFLTSGSVPMGILFSLIVAFFMLIQSFLLASQGHKPLLRFLFSMITPAGYTILRAATGHFDFLETTNILLWSAAAYVGFFQAVGLTVPAGLVKRFAETMLALGAAVIFVAFYYYLDQRINLERALEAGNIDATQYAEALRIQAFTRGLPAFFSSPQHWFAALGALSFDLMLLVTRMRAITLRTRIDRLLVAGGPQAPGDPVQSIPGSIDIETISIQIPRSDSPPRRAPVTVISSDILAFTDMSERLGPDRAVDLLNRYIALWVRMSGPRGGRILSITGDSLILVFGLADESDHAERGLSAALAFMDELPGLREDLTAAGLPSDLRVSVGVHSGIVVAAKMGAPGERRPSVFGDAVAVAARLDSLCRELNQDLLVSHPTFRRLSLESQAGLDRIGEVLLRKSTRPVPVYGRK
ncbi:MAG: adenylate/guanylate cyclase domain-containing protein [Rectinemataceae bacterium]